MGFPVGGAWAEGEARYQQQEEGAGTGQGARSHVLLRGLCLEFDVLRTKNQLLVVQRAQIIFGQQFLLICTRLSWTWISTSSLQWSMSTVLGFFADRHQKCHKIMRPASTIIYRHFRRHVFFDFGVCLCDFMAMVIEPSYLGRESAVVTPSSLVSCTWRAPSSSEYAHGLVVAALRSCRNRPDLCVTRRLLRGAVARWVKREGAHTACHSPTQDSLHHRRNTPSFQAFSSAL